MNGLHWWISGAWISPSKVRLSPRKRIFRDKNTVCKRMQTVAERRCARMTNDKKKVCLVIEEVLAYIYITRHEVLSAGRVSLPFGQNRAKSRGVTVNRSWWNNWSHTHSHYSHRSLHIQHTHRHTQTWKHCWNIWNVFSGPLPDCCITVILIWMWTVCQCRATVWIRLSSKRSWWSTCVCIPCGQSFKASSIMKLCTYMEDCASLPSWCVFFLFSVLGSLWEVHMLTENILSSGPYSFIGAHRKCLFQSRLTACPQRHLGRRTDQCRTDKYKS